jgi:glycosyltransferase involved in cell wall biosynthesis
LSARGRLGVLVRSFPKLSETFILGEILGLERAGFQVTVFTLRPPTDAIAQPLVAQVRAPIVLVAPPAPCGESAGMAGTTGADADPDDELARLLAAQLRRRGIGHLHGHFIDRPGAIAAHAAELAGITFSLSAHAKDIYLGDPRQIRGLLGAACFTVTCTGYNHEVLEGLAPPGASVHRVYHGIDTGRFAPARAPGPRPVAAQGAPAPTRILAVGRLREKKGFATLVRAVAALREQGVDAVCDIVGYGEQQPVLEAQIASLRLEGHVRLGGKMSHARIRDLYREADVFVAPSEIAADGDRDGIPNVLLEAMATALPVVTTPVSGIPEVVRDGENGLLVPPADTAALAAAIARLAASASLRERLGAAARRAVIAQFGEERNLAQLVGLLAPYVRPQTAGLGTGTEGRPHV